MSDQTSDMVSPGTTVGPPPARRRRLIVLAPLLVFGAMAAMFAFALTKGDPSKLPSALIGKPAPALALTAIEGVNDGPRAIPLLTQDDSVLSNITVVNFWASWCGPCVQEHPHLIELSRLPGVHVVGINYKDLAANARRFLGRYGNPYAAIGADTTGRTAIEWGVYGMPETFILDRKGRIVFKHVGPITPEVMRSKLIPKFKSLDGPPQPQRRAL
jgi:cytochrome c biogenesis protein CcmG, thiol:disulfide interchange protein DsbE